jgi:phenylacetate-CoA ligase
LTGLLGRVGDGVKVKGMFVRVGQMDAVMKRFPEVACYQATVTREQHQDNLAYAVELSESVVQPDDLTRRIADALRDEVKVRGEVRIVPAGTISAGAKKLNDCRVWK